MRRSTAWKLEVGSKHGGEANSFAPRGNTISPLRRNTTRAGRLNRCFEESRSAGKRKGRGGRKKDLSSSILETSRRGRSIFLDRLSSYRHILNGCGRGEGRIFDEKRETTRRRRVACSPLFRFGLIVVTIVSKKAIWMERQRGIRSKGDRLDRVPPRGETRVNEA